jgi:hypothetical protein
VPIPEIDRAIAATLRRLKLDWCRHRFGQHSMRHTERPLFPFINEVENVRNGGILLRTIPSARKPIGEYARCAE